MNINNTLIENLNRIIKDKGLKQRHIAELAHMDERKVSAILTGRQKNITATDIGYLCKALNSTPNELYGIAKTQQTRRNMRL